MSAESVGVGATEKASGPVAAATAAATGPLPCLNSHNSDDTESLRQLEKLLKALNGTGKKLAFALSANVREFFGKVGLNNVGFVTLTVADHVTDPREFNRRMNNINRRALKPFPWIRVTERMKSGRLHVHLLIAFPDDIRTGTDFASFQRKDYRSANPFLRKWWAWLRRQAKAHGFGRSQILPIRTNIEGVSRYVGKYIAKNLTGRTEKDRGIRLVGYSKGSGPVKPNNFAWHSPRATLWRMKLAEVAKRSGFKSFADFKEAHGSSWAYSTRKRTMDLELSSYPNPETARADGLDIPTMAAGCITVERSRSVDYWTANIGEFLERINSTMAYERVRRSRSDGDAWAAAEKPYVPPDGACESGGASSQASGALPGFSEAELDAGKGEPMDSSGIQRGAVRLWWEDEKHPMEPRP